MALALALLAAPLAAQTVTAPPSPPLKWGPHLDLEGKAGNKRNLGEGDLFVPLLQNGSSLLFGNLKGRFDDEASREGNIGLGLRHMLDSGWNLGGYGYFDRRRSEHDNYFNQVTLGAEALSLDWDVRFNAYLPQGRRSRNVDSLNTAEMSGTTVLFRGGEERSLSGFDGEIGWRLPLFDANSGRQLRVFAGAYRFTAEGVNPVQGPRARAELVFDEVPFLWSGSRFALGGEVQNDGPRGTTGFASARLRLPLQLFGGEPARLTAMERRMTDPVVRDIDVVAQAGAYITEIVSATAGGAGITVISSASTAGAALPAAVTAAGANSIVILQGTFNTTAITTLAGGQTLMGAGTLTVRSPSGRTATLTTSTATIAGVIAGFDPTVDMASNSTLSGLSVSNSQATGGVAVRANAVSGATIANNTLSASATGGAAIAIAVVTGASGIAVRNNTATASSTTSTATAIVVSASGATVAGNTLSASGSNAGNSRAVDLGTAVIAAGSTGNTNNGGNCTITAAGSGAVIAFNNAASCGP